MSFKDKLDYLCEQHESLTEQEKSEIQRLYRKVHARREAQTENIEVLSDALFTYNDLMVKRIDLLKLQELFHQYMREKGFKQSLLKVEEIATLIANDIQDNHHILEETKNLISGIKEILKQVPLQESGIKEI